MTSIEAAFLARIKRRTDSASADLVRRQLAAYQIIKDSLTQAELVAAIENGTMDQLLDDLTSPTNLDPALAGLRARLDQAIIDASRSEMMHGLPSMLRPTFFHVLNPLILGASNSLNIAAAEAIRLDLRQTIMQHVNAGLVAGTNPRMIAKTLPDVIGLNARQEKAVENFRVELQTGNRAALNRMLGKGMLRTTDGDVIRRLGHAANRGLTSKQLGTLMRMLGKEPLDADMIERMVSAYRKRLKAWNAESNARTLALQAQKKAQRLAWEDAVERGVVRRDDLVRTWIAVGGPVGDGRNRPEHLELHGTQVAFDEPFPNGEMEPGDSTYNCRCGARVTLAAMALANAAA